MLDQQTESPDLTMTPRTRRSFFRYAGALAAGLVGGAALENEQANATDGGPILAGSTTTAESTTTLMSSGSITNNGAFVVEATGSDWAIEGTSGQIGVLGSGFIGVSGTGDIGGSFSGNLAAISLAPQNLPGAPTSGDFSKGDILVDSLGVMHLCVADGNPGTWIKISHGGTRFLSAPYRAYDSRNAVAGKLRSADGSISTPRVIPIVGVVPGLPENAVGVVGNVTVTGIDAGSFLTVWPSGAWPNSSNLNFSSTDIANSFSCGLSNTGTLSVATLGQTHVIIDISGYVL